MCVCVCVYYMKYIYIIYVYNVYIYIYICVYIGLMSRLFINGPADRGSIPGRPYTKDSKKWYLMPPCLTLSIIM